MAYVGVGRVGPALTELTALRERTQQPDGLSPVVVIITVRI